jgi:hypothetical protein
VFYHVYLNMLGCMNILTTGEGPEMSLEAQLVLNLDAQTRVRQERSLLEAGEDVSAPGGSHITSRRHEGELEDEFAGLLAVHDGESHPMQCR